MSGIGRMHYLNILVAASSIAITYFLFRRWQYYVASVSNGCSPPRPYPHKDPLLGIDLFFGTGKALQEHRYLQELTKRYTKLGTTFRSKSLGAETIATIEPDNLQAVFSTNFSDWGVEPVRLPAQAPFCGKGFITTDGPIWEKSRSLLRPSFNKSNAVDLSALEEGVIQVFQKIPRDGKKFDMQPLIFSLVRWTFRHQGFEHDGSQG